MIPIFEPFFGNKEKENLLECIDSGWISSQGEFILDFEREFSKFHSMSYGIATSNCTTALHLSLVSLGIGSGDEVICPDLTFIAPANMIKWAGAVPVLVDIEKRSWGIDPKKIEAKITNRTKAIVVVHAFGHPADMDPIMKIAKKYDLYVIEDVAEAPGALYKGKLVGSFGDVSCYSFFANKIITTGEGGIVLTNNYDLDQNLRTYRDHGMSRQKRYVHTVPGFNYRMTNMQAAIGTAQLGKLIDLLDLRMHQEQKYKKLFFDSPSISWRPTEKWCQHVHWMSTITLQKEELRDPLLEHMKNQGIDCRQMVYPIHMSDIYKDNNNPDDFPVSRSISLRSLHLPSSINLKGHEQELIVDLINDWLVRNE